MAVFVLLFLLSVISCSAVLPNQQYVESGHISAVITEKGLIFAKDLLINRAISNLVPLSLPDIHKSKKIPVVGSVSASLTNIKVSSVNVSCSTIHPGESGVAIVASGASTNLTMDWSYSYSTWLIPIKLSDSGKAFVQVKGIEVGLTVVLEDQEGRLKLNFEQIGCYMENISILLDGGASWFYQGFLDAFEGEIRSILENTIIKKITEGASKLDSLLQEVPKEIHVDDSASLNVTFVNGPVYLNSSVEFDINGLFIASSKVGYSGFLKKKSHQVSISYGSSSEMLGITLDEAVMNSASSVYFQAGLLHWIVSKVPDQALLNTASWKFIIPQLYKKYPNENMELNISLNYAPKVRITPKNIGATIDSDMTVHVLEGNKAVPVACVSVVVSVNGAVEILGNNLVGRASLENFTLKLKWSDVGNFHMSLIQGVIRVFLDTVFMPFLNLQLRRGLPLPIIRGFTLQGASIITSPSAITVFTDVSYSNAQALPRKHSKNIGDEMKRKKGNVNEALFSTPRLLENR